MKQATSCMSRVLPRLRACGWLLLAGLASACTSETPLTQRLPELALLPGTVTFADAVANEETVTGTFNIENAGTAELRAELSIGGDDPGVFTVVSPDGGIVLDRGDSAVVEVSFAPDDLRDYAGEVIVEWNDPADEGPGVVTLTGTGRDTRLPDIAITTGPDCIQFASVDVGRTQQAFFDILNVGEAPLVIGSTAQSGSGAFRVANDPSGTTIEPGRRTSVLLEYSPVVADQGDSGAFAIPSNDPDEPEVEVCLEGNGGGDYPYPVAVIDCPGSIDVVGGADVMLDGSGSFDPNKNPLSYEWSILRRPAAADPDLELDPIDAAMTTLAIDAAGTWEVGLTVTASGPGADYVSVPEKCIIEAVPQDGVYVELTWSGPTSDFDLHLADDSAEFFTVPGDVSWCNDNPDWGTSGDTTDDPVLGPDVDDGFGPEYVTISEPADSTFLVRAHHFDDGEDGRTTATVQVFLSGELAWSGSKPLERNQVWDVGQINWADGNFGAFSTTPWDAGGVRECR